MDVDERERIRHRLRLLRGALDALDIALDQDGVPLGTDIAQNIASSATDVAFSIVRADAYALAAGRR
jgi:hypothetical protein